MYQLNMHALTAVLPGEVEVGHPLLVEALVPAYCDVVKRLTLLELAVVVSLKLHQGAKDVLVLVRILVPGQRRWGE